MDSQKDTPHPIAQYNSISNSQYSIENNASQFMIAISINISTECMNCGQLCKETTHLTREQLLRSA